MKVKLKILWQTGGALQRLAQIRFEEESLAYKIGRIHQALLGPEGAVTLAQKSYERLVRKFGEQVLEDGKPTGQWIVALDTEQETEFNMEWNRIVDPEEEFWGQRIAFTDLKPYLKQISAADIGALSTWLIAEEAQSQ